MTISAEIILDSISPDGHRLTTMKLRYPKFIHGEFMTHRVFSRNASSSRAVPTSKLLEEVRSDALRASPVFWGKNQKGMQAEEELSKEFDGEIGCTPWLYAQTLWRLAAIDAVNKAQSLVDTGAHKQIVNRILEPFLHINVVVTATEYDNFFGLRLDRAAQPEMRALAEAMWYARQDSEPTKLNPGEWHLPFVADEDKWDADEYLGNSGEGLALRIESNEGNRRISVARCARVSYENHETQKRSTVEEDLKLFDRLKAQGHWSPFEHQATPDSIGYERGDPHGRHGQIQTMETVKDWRYPHQHGNFVGWRQYRKMLPNEAKRPLPEEYR